MGFRSLLARCRKLFTKKTVMPDSYNDGYPVPYEERYPIDHSNIDY
jgi:hypothetical protein